MGMVAGSTTAVLGGVRAPGHAEAPFGAQLRSLESAAGGFARARAFDSIAAVADGAAGHGLGAGLLVLAVRDDDERRLRAVGTGRLPGRELSSVPLDGPGLLARVAREGAPAFVPWSLDALVRNGALRLSPRAPGFHRLAVLPLPGTEHPVGAMALGLPSGRGLSDDDRAFLTVLAGLCALAVERVRLSTDRSHVRALLRRRQRAPRLEGTQLTIGRMRIDLEQLRAAVDGRSATLTPSEFRVLMFLAEEPGRARTRREILQHLWQTEHVGGERACDAHIWNLRRKIERDPSRPRLVVTRRGIGYALEVL
jgi:GAF domain-containing protein